MVEWIYVNAFTGIYDELSLHVKISLIYKKQKIKTSKQKDLSSINLCYRHRAKIKLKLN